MFSDSVTRGLRIRSDDMISRCNEFLNKISMSLPGFRKITGTQIRHGNREKFVSKLIKRKRMTLIKRKTAFCRLVGQHFDILNM